MKKNLLTVVIPENCERFFQNSEHEHKKMFYTSLNFLNILQLYKAKDSRKNSRKKQNSRK